MVKFSTLMSFQQAKRLSKSQSKFCALNFVCSVNEENLSEEHVDAFVDWFMIAECRLREGLASGANNKRASGFIALAESEAASFGKISSEIVLEM